MHPVIIYILMNRCYVSRNDDMGLGILIKNHQVKRIVCSFIGNCHELEKQYLDGDIEVVLSPQGSLAERIRAGGAGIPAFYTPTGYATLVHKGEPVKFDHDHHVEIESRGKEVRVGERRWNNGKKENLGSK